MDLLALQLRAVADTDDVELLLEAIGHTGNGVRHQAAGETVELAQLIVFARELGHERAGVLREQDARRQRLTQLALRSLDFDRVGRDLDGHALRDRDRFLTNSRHVSSTKRCRALRRRRRPCARRDPSSRRARSSGCWSRVRRARWARPLRRCRRGVPGD